MDERLLQSFGLNARETELFKVILKQGNATPVDLAKATGVKRTTAYSIARGLVEKGLVIENSTHRPRTFSVVKPEEVLRLLENEKRELKDKEEMFKSIANELSKVSAEKSYPVPTVRFVEEDKIDSFLRQRSTEWTKSMLEVDPVFWGFQDPSFLTHHSKWIDWYWDKAPKELSVKLLTNRTSAEKAVQGRYERRFTKFWGEATNFLSTTWVIGDYVVTINTRNKPFYLIEIHDKLMAHDQREVFKNLWPLVD